MLRAKESLFSSGSLCGDGPGEDDGWFYTKPPSPGRIIQSCVFSGTNLFIRPLSPTSSCARLSSPPLTHSFTYPRIRPTVTKQLPRARCSAWSWGGNAARAPASAHPDAQAGLRNGPRLRQGVRLAVPSETTFRCLGALQNRAASRGPDGCLRLCSRSTALAAEFRG